jgi:hypothetical protein
MGLEEIVDFKVKMVLNNDNFSRINQYAVNWEESKESNLVKIKGSLKLMNEKGEKIFRNVERVQPENIEFPNRDLYTLLDWGFSDNREYYEWQKNNHLNPSGSCICIYDSSNSCDIEKYKNEKYCVGDSIFQGNKKAVFVKMKENENGQHVFELDNGKICENIGEMYKESIHLITERNKIAQEKEQRKKFKEEKKEKIDFIKL